MKFKSQSASTNQLQKYPRFTNNNLEEMAKSAPEKAILWEFNQEKVVGKVKSAEVSDGVLTISAG